jgi:glutamyl-tRNA synthetase
MMTKDQPRGVRFAPSPTGNFHLGNLRTAWISHWWARALGEPWIVRFEDIDKPRVLTGAQNSQLDDMAALGLKPDEIVNQSARIERHQDLFRRAKSEGIVYPCYCSRAEILEATRGAASAPHSAQPLYNGKCRPGRDIPKNYKNPSIAWRLKALNASGNQDAIIARTSPQQTDFVPAYHWACAIDDYDGGYSLLVRAWDLASAAKTQKLVFDWLSTIETPKTYPAIFHTSLVTQNDGHRLEKRTPNVTLKELAAQGTDIKAILNRFKASFEKPNLELKWGKPWGEEKRELKLQELGQED